MSFTPERDPVASHSRSQSIHPDSPVRRNPLRPKKPPPITPRRFTKFFTPRPLHGIRTVRTSRKALRDISGPNLNKRAKPNKDVLPTPKGVLGHASLITDNEEPHGHKRKLSFTDLEDSFTSSPSRRTVFFPSSSQDVLDEQGVAVCASSPLKAMDQIAPVDEDTEECSSDYDAEEHYVRHREPLVKQYGTINLSANLLCSRLSGRRAKRVAATSSLWQDETANFYSLPSDVQSSTSLAGSHVTLPFCVSSCNTNSLTAIGDEEGGIRLLDSASTDKDGFKKLFLSMKPHNNAIMDMAFSEDDLLLATAAGDQTSHIIDVQTQQTVYCLSGHTSSLKRVQFQPGSGSKVLATCSRDGNVNIWDLRTEADRPSQHLRSNPRAPESSSSQSHRSFYPDGTMRAISQMKYIPLTNQIRGAHSATFSQFRSANEHEIESARVRGKYSDSSVTSLAFIPDPGRAHLLVTSSEANAMIKVWDMRTSYNSRRPRPHPVSATPQPTSHRNHRQFGLTSIVFSGDGSKLYSLCRDHTVYAYSTSHLILGDAPELSSGPSRPRRPGGPERQGLGPIHAFRHHDLSVSTFYPKLAIRKATVNNPEILAVGSSENCTVLFPTTEHHLTSNARRPTDEPHYGARLGRNPSSDARRGRGPGTSNLDSPHGETLPIYRHGTALVRGHSKEVTGVAWNFDGSLTTISDDFSARCWRENAVQARGLRQGGESEGKRWMAGWAHVTDDSYDD